MANEKKYRVAITLEWQMKKTITLEWHMKNKNNAITLEWQMKKTITLEWHMNKTTMLTLEWQIKKTLMNRNDRSNTRTNKQQHNMQGSALEDNQQHVELVTQTRRNQSEAISTANKGRKEGTQSRQSPRQTKEGRKEHSRGNLHGKQRNKQMQYLI